METWNREELYAGVWEQPLVKLALKYGISGVALGRSCIFTAVVFDYYRHLNSI